VFADSSLHARLILEYQFGMNALSSSPNLVTKEDHGYKNLEEAIGILKPLKPKTPQQLTIDTLKKQKEQADTRLKAERERQKLVKAQKSIFNLSRPN
jgi:hypothetical protein